MVSVGTCHGPERAPLDLEHTGEELVVLQPQRLDRGYQRLESEGDGIADDEDGDGGDGSGGAAMPQAGRGGPDDPAEHGVGEAERGEAGEGDDVGAEADHQVDHLDAGLQRTAGSAAGAGQQTDVGEDQSDGRHDSRDQTEPGHVPVDRGDRADRRPTKTSAPARPAGA